MDGQYIKAARTDYAKNNSRSDEIMAHDTYEPILELTEMHPEAAYSPDVLNNMMSDINCDVKGLDNEFTAAANQIDSLASDIKIRLQSVYDSLAAEQEKLQDINLLCNQYTDFTKVLTLGASDFTGNFSSDKDVFSLPTNASSSVNYAIVSITGNGYEGNNYVVSSDALLKDAYDTSKRSYINDSSIMTAYEYSRITIDSIQTDLPSFLNLDNIEARCMIAISAVTTINQIKITGKENMIVTGLFVSNDGVSFTQIPFSDVSINNEHKKYQISDYINGSGIINFPASKYVKIGLQSNGYTNDIIGYYQNT